jgi:hypothetical protein
MTNTEKVQLAREFFRQVLLSAENEMTDEIYAEIDPDEEYGDELPSEFNLDTVREVLALGFAAKYGEPM